MDPNAVKWWWGWGEQDSFPFIITDTQVLENSQFLEKGNQIYLI